MNNRLVLEDVQKGHIESIVCTAHFTLNFKQNQAAKS